MGTGSGRLPPSSERVDWREWMLCSAMLGGAIGLGALALSWRALPGLPAPEGALGEHWAHWWRMAVHAAFRPAFGDAARDYARWWQAAGPEGRFAVMWRCAFASWCAILPAFALASKLLAPRDALLHVRGARRLSGREAAAALREELAPRLARLPDHEMAPGVGYPGDLWARHFLLVAGTGAGKSTVLKPLLSKIVAADERVLMFDPKCEFTAAFPEAAIVSPWDARSWAWDVGRDIESIPDMRRFADSTIADSHDPMWAAASRQILVAALRALRREHGSDWGWRELAEALEQPRGELAAMIEEAHPEALRPIEAAGATSQGVLINLASFCAPIFDLRRAWGDVPRERRVSFKEWAFERGPVRQIVLQGSGGGPRDLLGEAVARGIVDTIAAVVCSPMLSEDPRRKLWIVADEFPQIGKIASIRRLFDLGRAKGCRVGLACQDFAQVEETYGPLFVRSINSMCATILVGQMSQGETADALAKHLGTREVERPNESFSSSGGSTVSFARDEVALYKPSELGSRLGPTRDGRGVVMALVTGGKAYELFWPRFDLKPRRETFVPAAWLDGTEAEAPAAASLPASQPPADAAEPFDAMAIAELLADGGEADGWEDAGESPPVAPGSAREPQR